MPVAGALGYGERRVNRTGLAATVLLHLLLVLIYFLKPPTEKTAPPPNGAAIAYVAPLQTRPKQPQKKPPKPPSKPVLAKVERLPDTITLPEEKPVELDEPEPEPPKPLVLPPEQDMSAAIEARRRARGQTEAEPRQESAAERGQRIAMANIAAANGRSMGDAGNDTGGVFSVTEKSFSSANLKFRGWNPNFKRRWLQQVDVELGSEPDIETAIVKKMIELIRKEKKGDFDWDSHRLQRVVKMSAREADTAELHAFLMKEMFPEYAPPRGR